MADTSKQSLGKQGEALACDHLKEQGYAVVHRNFRFGRAELDIVCVRDNTLVIVEVKSYQSDPLGEPEFRISRRQQRQIIQAAYAFLDRFREYQDYDVRFDVVIIDFGQYPAGVSHYEAAFWDDRGWG